MRPPPCRPLTLALACLILAGCGTTKPSRFYQLNLPAGSPDAVPAAGPSWALRSVKLPAYLDRTPLVLRKGPNEIELDEYSRWAEPLEAGLARLLAPPDLKPEPAWLVDVEVILFDVDVSGQGVLEARWSAKPAKNGAARSGYFRQARPAAGPDPANRAAALSALALDLRKAMAAELAESESGR